MSKINNSLKEEYKSTGSFVRKIRRDLNRKAKSSKIFWITFSIIIALINIAILTVSSIALDKVIAEYNSGTTKADFTSQVLPTILVSVLTIGAFILSIIISTYQGFMKSKTYKEAKEYIQYTYFQYKSKENKLNEVEFKSLINKKYKKAVKHRNENTFKKSLISIFTGGSDE